MLPLPVALLTLVLCACSVGAQDLIFFEFVVEDIFEGQSNNITLRRFGIVQGDIQINYTITGLGLSSPDDFTGGSFSIVYPPTEDPLKVPIDVKDNSVCDNGRGIFVRITGIDKAPIPETDLRLFVVVDDDGEWTAWDTSEGPCNCDTDMRERVRNRTCNDKGIAGRTCDGPGFINDTVSCAGDPACTTTTTQMPSTTTPWTAWSAPWTAWSEPRRWQSPPRRWWSAPWRWLRGWKGWRGWSAPHPSTDPTNWSEWGPDGLCSATCDGIQKELRTRTCNSPGAALNETRSVPCSPPCPWTSG
ncbi:properdin-like [Haliotis cracherodii]|uniref:properdin-like n=1 Tax=Haliotis cracherodii TaxID=6455 RepID=UPI0039EBDF8B